MPPCLAGRRPVGADVVRLSGRRAARVAPCDFSICTNVPPPLSLSVGASEREREGLQAAANHACQSAVAAASPAATNLPPTPLLTRRCASPGNDGPTIVSVNTLVRSISKIDDVTMVSCSRAAQVHAPPRAKSNKSNVHQPLDCRGELCAARLFGARALHVARPPHNAIERSALIAFGAAAATQFERNSRHIARDLSGRICIMAMAPPRPISPAAPPSLALLLANRKAGQLIE